MSGYTPDNFSVENWESPINIVEDDRVADLDEAINGIISLDGGSLKNYINNSFVGSLRQYLANEFSKIFTSLDSSISEFKGIYYGSYSSEPTKDPNGNDINEGDLYYDTSTNMLKVYSNGSWSSVWRYEINGGEY